MSVFFGILAATVPPWARVTVIVVAVEAAETRMSSAPPSAWMMSPTTNLSPWGEGTVRVASASPASASRTASLGPPLSLSRT